MCHDEQTNNFLNKCLNILNDIINAAISTAATNI